MAKRKSTDKSSQGKTDNKADADDISEITEATTEGSDLSAQPEDDPRSPDVEDTAETAEPEADATAPEETEPANTSDDTLGDDAKTEDVTAASDDADAIVIEEPTSDDPVDGDTTEITTDTETVDGTHAASEDPLLEGDQPSDHLSEEEAERLIEEAETTELSSDTSSEVTDTTPVPPEVIRETVVERKGGFAPMLLGGAVAAALGYGGAAYVSQDVWPFAGGAQEDTFQTEVQSSLDAQAGSLSEIADRLTALEGIEPPTVDLTPVETAIAGVQDTAANLSARLDEIAARVETLERQPLEQAVSPAAIASYENALAELQAEVEAQRLEVQNMAQEAMEAEGNAAEQAQLAASRAALADLTAALDTGAPFADAVAVLSSNGVDVPQALSAHAENGIATQSALSESFPEAARAALSAARSAATESSEGANRVATFFANQLGARSVAPREGDDPDAILSRAEAAVRSGDLATALSELSALPDVAQSAVSSWQTSASTRLEAKTAADTIVQQLLQE